MVDRSPDFKNVHVVWAGIVVTPSKETQLH